MAKADDVSFLEQHVEKLVLLVCLVLLGVAGHRWILSSPVSMSGVPVEQLDEVLSERALRVKHDYDTANVPVKPVPKWAGKTLSLRTIVPQQREDIDLASPRLPMKVDIGGPGGEEGLVRLAELIAAMPVPSRPVVAAAMELPDKTTLADVAVAHGTLVYPLADLAKAWTEPLAKKNIPVKVTVQEVIVEVQEELANGQWGPVRRVPVAARADAKGDPIVVAEVPDFNGTNVEEVRGARDKLAQQQDHVLRPQYYRIWSPGRGWMPWQTRLPKVEPSGAKPAPVAPGVPVVASPVKTSVWFHDETMKVGRRYRYRIKLKFVNPILTYDKAVSDEHLAEARQTYIETKESEWSDLVSVDRKVHFFLTGASATTKQMTVTIFANKWGQTVMRTFGVRAGEPIGDLAEINVRSPKTGQMEPVEVDFSTGAVSLRFLFRIKWLRGSFQVPTAKMLYLDSEGRLQARIQARDNGNPLRRELIEEAKRALAGG